MSTQPGRDNANPIDTVRRLYRSRDFGSMEKACNSILAKDPDNRDAKFYLGLSSYEGKRLLEAERRFRELVVRNSRDHAAEYSLGVTLMDLGRLVEAEQALAHVVAINPSQLAKDKLAEVRTKLANVRHSSTSDTSARPGPIPSPTTEGSSAPSIAKNLAAGRMDPGLLKGKFRRLLRSYMGRFILVGVLSVAGFALMASSESVRSLARAASFVPDAERRLADAINRGLPPHIVEMAQAGLEKSKNMESVILWVSGFFVVVLLLLPALVLLLTALIGPSMSSYRIYERRVDLTHGVLLRKTAAVWIYQITKVTIEAPLTLSLVGTASLLMQTEKETFKLVGLDAETAELLREWLATESQVQRYNVKQIWL